MENIFDTNMSRRAGHHARAARRAYVTLAVAFVCMMGLNAVAYLAISKMNHIYVSQQGVSMKLRLNAIQANLLFKEIMGGDGNKDMNSVWKLMDASKELSKEIDARETRKMLQQQLDIFKGVMLKCYQAFSETNAKRLAAENAPAKLVGSSKAKIEAEQAASKQQEVFAAMKQQYATAFDDLLDSANALEATLKSMIEGKIRLFNGIYVALPINMLALFGFIFFTFRSYINKGRVAEEQMLGAQENLSTIINTLEAIIVVVDSAGCVTQWSEVASSRFNIKADDAKDKVLWELIPSFVEFKSDILRVFHSKQSLELLRVECDALSGRLLNIAMSYSSGIRAVVLRVDDITEKEKMDEQLRQSQTMEVTRNLIQGMANNFNNVLSAIVGNVSMLKFSHENHQLNSDEDIGDYIDTIEHSTHRAEEMVQQLVALSEREEAKLRPVDLSPTLQCVADLCANTVDKRVTIDWEECGRPVLTVADPKQVEQLLLNLCDNAAQAMTVMRGPDETQGGTLSVKFGKVFANRKFIEEHPDASEGSYWVFSVVDTGKGIDEETAPQIFEPFFSTKRNGETQAPGLGLTMVRDIVESHKGFLEFDSTVNQGSTFTVYLPELDDEAAAIPLRKEFERAKVQRAATAAAAKAAAVVAAAASEEAKAVRKSAVAASQEPVATKGIPVMTGIPVQAQPQAVAGVPVMRGIPVQSSPPEPAVVGVPVMRGIPVQSSPPEPAVTGVPVMRGIPVQSSPPEPAVTGIPVMRGIPVQAPQPEPAVAGISVMRGIPVLRGIPVPMAAATTGPKLVLVVDDEDVLRKTAKSILKKLGYEALFAENGEDGVNLFKERHQDISVVLLDMVMPKMSGKEAFAEMKKIDAGVKAVVVSAFSMNKDIQDVLDLGGSGFIKKPYSIMDVAQELNRCLGKQEA